MYLRRAISGIALSIVLVGALSLLSAVAGPGHHVSADLWVPTRTHTPTVTGTPTMTITPTLTLTPGPTSEETLPPTATTTHRSTNTPTLRYTYTPTASATGDMRPTPPSTVPVTTSTPTATLTDTPTATPTHTPSPVRLPLIMLQRLHLRNNGFESGAFLPGWIDSGELARTITGTQTYEGNYAALLGDPTYDTMGGCPFGRATIQQTFDVPSEGHPMLYVWFRLYSYDTKDYDYFAIDIAPWPVGPAESVFRYGSPYWLNGNLWNSGWIQAPIPLDAYLGQRISIRIYNAMTNDDGYYNTWTYVDEITVE